MLYTPKGTRELRGPDEDHPRTHWLTLSCDDHTIAVEYQYTLTRDGRRLKMEARAKMLRRFLDSAGEIQSEPSSARWLDHILWGFWETSFGARDIAFTLGLTKLILKLGLDWTAPSHYALRLEIVTEMLLTAPAAPLESTQGEEHLVSGSNNGADERDTVTAAVSSECRVPGSNDSELEEELLFNEDTARLAMHGGADGALSESDKSVDEDSDGGACVLS